MSWNSPARAEPDVPDAVMLAFASARPQIDLQGRGAITLGGYTLEEVREPGLLEDESKWMEMFRVHSSPDYW